MIGFTYDVSAVPDATSLNDDQRSDRLDYIHEQLLIVGDKIREIQDNWSKNDNKIAAQTAALQNDIDMLDAGVITSDVADNLLISNQQELEYAVHIEIAELYDLINKVNVMKKEIHTLRLNSNDD